jgi:hypothetical protein
MPTPRLPAGRLHRAARESDLPEDVLENIAQSRRYVEGTAVRIEVRTVRDLKAVEALSAIKLAHRPVFLRMPFSGWQNPKARHRLLRNPRHPECGW